MKEQMSLVPKVSIRRDPRFNLEQNWKIVEDNVRECQSRGVLVTPLTVFTDGVLIGWYLHGWIAPPPQILYFPPEILHQCPLPDEYIPDYSI
jgi:hypothetical protein